MRRIDKDVSPVEGHGYMDFGLLNRSPFVAESCEDIPDPNKYVRIFNAYKSES